MAAPLLIINEPPKELVVNMPLAEVLKVTVLPVRSKEPLCVKSVPTVTADTPVVVPVLVREVETVKAVEAPKLLLPALAKLPPTDILEPI